MGTSEIYRAVASVDAITDALVVDVPRPGTEGWMPLFVVLAEDAELTDDLVAELRRRIREQCSPRHVPDRVYEIVEVPRTLSGKVLEVPVKRILTGTPPHRAAARDSLANPDSLDFFVELAGELESERSGSLVPAARQLQRWPLLGHLDPVAARRLGPYSARSAAANSSSWPIVSMPGRWIAIPQLTVSCGSVDANSLATAIRRRSAMTRPPASSASGATIANSSPPIRAVTSIDRVTSSRIVATRCRASSPAGWP